MKLLLLLCLGLTLVCAQEGNSDVVRSNFDIPKVRAGKHSDFEFCSIAWEILKQGGDLWGQEFLDIVEEMGGFKPWSKGSGAVLKGDSTCGASTYRRNSEQWQVSSIWHQPTRVQLNLHMLSPGPEVRVQGDKGSCCIPFLFSHTVILLIYFRLQGSGIPFSWPQMSGKT